MKKSLILVLISICPLAGCEFDQAPAGENASVVAQSGVATFTWNDDAGTHEIKRGLSQSLNSSSVPVIFSKVPSELRISNFSFQPGECKAFVWVDGKRQVRTECVRIPDASEILVRGLSLILETGLDGIHTVQLSLGNSSLSFKVRSLPNSVPLINRPAPIESNFFANASGMERLRTLALPQSFGGDTRLKIPTSFKAQLVRRFLRRTFERGFCRIEPVTNQLEEVTPIEVRVVQNFPGLERDWPEAMSKDIQTLNLKSNLAVPRTVSIYASHPYLNQFYGEAFSPEISSPVSISGTCKTSDPGSMRQIGGGSEPIARILNIGRDEQAPLLRFLISDIEVSSPEADELDQSPVHGVLKAQAFEIELSKASR